jgi:mannitol/fructose-specific phosphotransferase system IIA component (Ntr-type)
MSCTTSPISWAAVDRVATLPLVMLVVCAASETTAEVEAMRWLISSIETESSSAADATASTLPSAEFEA